MLVSIIENFVLFCTVLTLVGFALSYLVKAFTVKRFWRLHPNTLSKLYAAAILLPPIISAWLVCAAFLPEMLLGKKEFSMAHAAPLHELHLLGELTAKLEPALAYFTLTFLVAATCFALYSTIRGYVLVGSIIKRIEIDATMPPPEKVALIQNAAATYGLNVGLVMSNYPFSFVWGFGRSKLLLSSGTLCSLTSEELLGVLEHEAAHHRRRDNLIKLVLNVCLYSSLAFPLARRLMRWRALEVEMVCDEVAAAQTGAPLEIAEALVKLRKQTLVQINCSTLPTASGFVTDDESGLERRVSRLIEFADELPSLNHAVSMSKTNKLEALFTIFLFAVTLFVVSLIAPLSVHHAAESLINFLG